MIRSSLILLFAALLVFGSAEGQRAYDTDILRETFGFNESTKKIVDLADLRQGCPARDCIPSIDKPKYVAAKDARHVADDDLVVTLSYEGQFRAYPTKILDHHEIVNDTVAGDPMAITWCPLCGSAVGIHRLIDGEETTFGVSGVLYNSDLVLYDRSTETLWDQIEAKGIVGPQTGQRLTFIPTSISRWAKWRDKHPETLVLSEDTGFDYDYSADRYAEYRDSTRLFMPVSHSDDRVHAKTVVFGFESALGTVAYSEKFLETNKPYRHELGDEPVLVELHDDGSVTMQHGDQTYYPIRLFWFAWYTFHPETDLKH